MGAPRIPRSGLRRNFSGPLFLPYVALGTLGSAGIRTRDPRCGADAGRASNQLGQQPLRHLGALLL